MSKGNTAPESHFALPETGSADKGGEHSISSAFFNDPSLTRAMADYRPVVAPLKTTSSMADAGSSDAPAIVLSAQQGAALQGDAPAAVAPVAAASVGEGPTSFAPASAPSGGMSDFPMLNPSIAQQVSSAGDVSFSTPDQNKTNPPDYRLSVGPDGKVQLEKVGNGDPLADGKLNIEIDPKNKSLQDAIKNADKNLKEYVREMMSLWQRSNPGKAHPGWWDDVLNSQPNVPQDTAPVPTRAAQPQRLPETPAAAPAGSDSGAGGGNGGGGGGGGGGFAGTRGFDGGGYYKGNGSSGDGNVWTGNSDAKGAPVGPGEQAKAKDIYDYFVEKGFSPAQASGILGNIQTESSFKTNAYNAGEGAIGLCQWEGGRRTQLESFAKQEGKPVTDLHVQLDFIMHEFQTSEKGAYAAVKAASTPEQAAQAFQSKFERSANLGDRAANARNLHTMMA